MSNQLADETWIKERDWAIANGICGFAGLPLAIEKTFTFIGVLAVFNRQPIREAVAAVSSGETWEMDSQLGEGLSLSEREQEVITLLAHGLRDRNIAQKLHISESTVKFHINNSLTKLNAKNQPHPQIALKCSVKHQ